MWFYMLPLGGQDVFKESTFWLGLFYVGFPLGHILYGWNDYVDGEADQINPRKGNYLFGAKGSRAELAKLPWAMFLVQLPFAVVFALTFGPKALLWHAGVVLAAGIYNWPRWGLKSRPPFEVLNQAGYLLVFVLSSWLNNVSLLSWQAMVFGAMFAMHSHLFGEIMDIDPDRQSGRRTTATVLGRQATKLLVVGFLVAESALVFHYSGDIAITFFLGASAAFFLVDALLIWRSRAYSPREMRFAMVAWNVLALASMPWVWWTAHLCRVTASSTLK